MPRKSASKKQRGGSLASNRVMENLDTVAATHDYVVSPRIRTSSKLGNTETYKLTGGACGACGGHKHSEGFRGCGATAPTQSGGARRKSNKSGKSSGKNRKTLRKSSGKNRKTRKTRKTREQRGGQESNNNNTNDILFRSLKGILETLKDKLNTLKGNLNSLKGKCKGKGEELLSSSNNQPPDGPDQGGEALEQEIMQTIKEIEQIENKLDKLSKDHKIKLGQRGGGSAWLSSHNSGSLSNSTHARSCHFTKYPITSRGIYLNPPNMGLAGSGLGGTYDNHAPV